MTLLDVHCSVSLLVCRVCHANLLELQLPFSQLYKSMYNKYNIGYVPGFNQGNPSKLRHKQSLSYCAECLDYYGTTSTNKYVSGW
jgi:hypothetical protein